MKLLLKQQDSIAIIYTPISPDTPITKDMKSLRWVGLEFKLKSFLNNLQKNVSFEKA